MKYLDETGQLKKPEVMTNDELWGYVMATLKDVEGPSAWYDSNVVGLMKTHAACARIAGLCLKELKKRIGG